LYCNMKRTVYNGCDLLDSAKVRELLEGKKLGLITNMSGVTRSLKTTSSVLASMYDLCTLFGPEHGIRGAMQAGDFDKESFKDPETGVPVYDLHGKDKEPAENALSKLDAVLFDIQDIGVRYYTYQYAMLDAMKLCAKHGVQMIILDRVDPLGGTFVGGNRIEESCTSGVGAVPSQPAICGMTIGELALWFNAYLNIGADVSVIPCDGWDRSMWFDDTDLLFVPPSPNMPSLDTNILYPGTCFIEGTNLSEGRGTTKPFEIFGAPWMEPERVIDAMNSLSDSARETFEGIVFRPCSFTPMFHKHAGELCGGIQLHLRDRNSVDMYGAGLHILSVLRQLYPSQFEFRPFIMKLVGTSKVMEPDFDANEYVKSQKAGIDAFIEERKQYLLY